MAGIRTAIREDKLADFSRDFYAQKIHNDEKEGAESLQTI
jgi:queuine/archaeosine tRNA-ribosyltransferase